MDLDRALVVATDPKLYFLDDNEQACITLASAYRKYQARIKELELENDKAYADALNHENSLLSQLVEAEKRIAELQELAVNNGKQLADLNNKLIDAQSLIAKKDYELSRAHEHICNMMRSATEFDLDVQILKNIEEALALSVEKEDERK